jgi:hypothetical protein
MGVAGWLRQPPPSGVCPLNAYCESDLPGSLPFYTVTLWFVNEGRCSLRQLYPFAKKLQRTREQREAVKRRILGRTGLSAPIPERATPSPATSDSPPG